MPNRTAGNDQITDAVTQQGVQVGGGSPTQGLSNLLIAVGNAMGNSAHNATTQQQQTALTAQVANAMAIGMLAMLETATTARATDLIFGNE